MREVQAQAERLEDVSLFEQFPSFYALLREHFFRDDTERIIAALWPDGAPPCGSSAIELGCGPGFYARRLAVRFPQLQVIGIDASARQLELAVTRAAERRLFNCRFERDDAQALGRDSRSVDALIASRLMTILPWPQRAIFEIERVLRPGGRCFIAEPLPHPLARVPLRLLWAAADLARGSSRASYREPVAPHLLEPPAFGRLVSSVAWADVTIWSDRRYQYALCTKA
jgi:ubiquinone/menaquinone biosynthesis C-methylase UbiE